MEYFEFHKNPSKSFSKKLCDIFGEPFLNINEELFMDVYLGKYIFIFIKIILIFPLYQILLLIFGAIFFQFTFFWNIEKQLLKKIGFKKFF